MSSSLDRHRVRRAALRVGMLVALTSSIVVIAGVIVLVVVAVHSAHAERGGSRAGHDGDEFVVDLDHLLPWLIAFGVTAVLLLGGVAWWAARRAVGPLSDALRLQRQFVADASHELRTPLTALSARVQMLQRRQARGEQIEPVLAELRRDTRVMNDVLTDMLLSAEGQAAADEPADVCGCIAVAAALLMPIAEESNVSIRWECTAARTRMSQTTLTRLTLALVDNALQHAPGGTLVLIHAINVDHEVELRVTDQGSGIDLADRGRIFERFARGAESGRRRGFGLGLALVREAAQRAGGTVSIEQTSEEGTTFLLRLPSA